MQDNTTRADRFFFAVLVTVFVAVAAPACWGQVVNEDLKLFASDGAASDYFGASIAINNGIVAVGADQDDDYGRRSGSAYLFNESDGAQITKLTPDDGEEGDHFGWSIAIDNGIVAVAAKWDSDNGFKSGSAYLFDASTGAQITKLLPSDGAEGDRFGISIAIKGGLVAIGANRDDDNGTNSGSTYLFDASTGAQIAKLLPSDGAVGDKFGFSVAIDDGVVAVGAPGDDDNGRSSGSAYLFDASTGAQIAKLLPSDGAEGDEFGRSIAISNGVVAVGAERHDDNGHYSGSAYLFDASTGAQIAELLSSDGAAEDNFGWSIAISNGIVAVGAHNGDDNGKSSGSAYIFNASTGAQIAKLLPSDGAEWDKFGFSVAVDNDIVAVGAIQNRNHGTPSGSVFVFYQCPADFNNDGNVNTYDVIAFVRAYNAADPRADMNGDGVVNTLDFLAFLNAYNEGC